MTSGHSQRQKIHCDGPNISRHCAGNSILCGGKSQYQTGIQKYFGNGHMKEKDIMKCVSTVFIDSFLKLYLYFHVCQTMGD